MKFYAIPVGHDDAKQLFEEFDDETKAREFCEFQMRLIYADLIRERDAIYSLWRKNGFSEHEILADAIKRHYNDPNSVDWIVLNENDARVDYPELFENED